MPLTDTFFGEGVSPLVLFGVMIGSYFLGCFATGYYLVRFRDGRDVRQLGSGSTGGRNVGRILGPTGFLLTVAGDVAKGAIAVGVARALTGNDSVALLALLAVVAGHIWPVQLGCRGGKGVATSLAGLLAWDWQVALIFCVVYAAGCSLTRKSVASSLVAYAMLPAGVFWLGRSTPDLCGISILAGVVILAHYRNMAEGIHELMLHRRIAPETEQSVKDL